jgi:hypothetical protein
MFPPMFDRIMENSMALWLPVSAAYLVFLAAMIVKAFRHFRRARARAYGAGPERAFASPRAGYGRETAGRAAESRNRDWSPAR